MFEANNNRNTRKNKFHLVLICDETGKYDLIQEFIEAIINSNTNLKMEFLIFGIEEFADNVSGVLRYLNIEPFSIKSKII